MTEETLVEQALHLPKRESTTVAPHEARPGGPGRRQVLGLPRERPAGTTRRSGSPSRRSPITSFAARSSDTVRKTVRRHSLGDGVYADVRGFPDIAPSFDAGAPPRSTPGLGPGPHDAVESRDRLRAVAGLPDRERIALIRTVVDGDTAADVAKDAGVSPHRVYSLVHDGSARARGGRRDMTTMLAEILHEGRSASARPRSSRAPRTARLRRRRARVCSCRRRR